MDLGFLIFSLGAIPYLSTRMFSTLFWVGILGFLQQDVGSLQTQMGIFQVDFLVQLPQWYMAPEFLFSLFVLACAEGSSERSPLVSEFLRIFDAEFKAIGTFLLENVVTVSAAVSVAGGLAYHAGFGLGTLWGLLVSGGVWGVAKLRGALLMTLAEIDDDDDLGIRRLIGWLEELWVALGVWLLILLPLLALLIAGGTVLCLFLLQQHLKKREEASKLPCPDCGTLNLPTALDCLSCRRSLPAPKRVGVLGGATREPVVDGEAHRLKLLTKRRCPVCATRLPKRAVRQPCPGCGTEVFPSAEELDRYLQHAQERLPKTLGICFALSLIPFFGLIPGILYYRLSLISGLRIYVPLGTGCATRWLVRLLNLLLLGLQWIPVLGGLTLPLMCLVNYWVYRKVLEGERRKQFLAV